MPSPRASNILSSFGRFILFLLLGVLAVFTSGYTFTTPESRGGGSWDLTPLAGFLFGGPTWIISFPIIYFYLLMREPDPRPAFLKTAVASFILTLAIPQGIVFILRAIQG